MSTEQATSTAPPADSSWGVWKAQVSGILRLEIRKSLLGRRALPLVFLASLPVLLFGMRAILPLSERSLGSLGDASMAYSVMFQTFMLRMALFFGHLASENRPGCSRTTRGMFCRAV